MSEKHYDINYLEGTATVLKKLKERSYNPFLTISDGTIIDLGCGTGADAINLAKLLGDKVTVTGIDHDPQMIEKAVTSAGGIQNINFILSEAASIPFTDSSVAGVRTERLIQHLKEPQKTFHDIYRILKPEHPLVIVETDWYNLSFYNIDIQTEAKVNYYLTHKKINNGTAARELTRNLENTGFRNIRLEIFPFVLKSLNEINMYLLIDQSLKEMKDLGHLTTDEYNSLLSSMERADSGGYFACSINLVVVSALK